MSKTSLVKKLRIQTGHKALILNPPSNYLTQLGDLPDNVSVSHKPKGKFDFVQVFIKNSTEWNELGESVLVAVEYDGLLWVCYPKKSAKVDSDLSRDVVWKLLENTGLRPVTQISIDDIWSALRFRPTEVVGK